MLAGIDYVGISLGFICHDGQGNILMHKRSKNTRDQHGHWDWGGGKMELGETIEEGLLRELQEEYGVDGKIEHVLPPVDWVSKGKITAHWVVLLHIVKVDRDKVINNEPRSIEELGWFDFDNLPDPLHEGNKYDLELHGEEIRKYIKK